MTASPHLSAIAHLIRRLPATNTAANAAAALRPVQRFAADLEVCRQQGDTDAAKNARANLREAITAAQIEVYGITQQARAADAYRPVQRGRLNVHGPDEIANIAEVTLRTARKVMEGGYDCI